VQDNSLIPAPQIGNKTKIKKAHGTSTLTLSTFKEEAGTKLILLPEALGYFSRNG
jgi:hypothetical protein